MENEKSMNISRFQVDYYIPMFDIINVGGIILLENKYSHAWFDKYDEWLCIETNGIRLSHIIGNITIKILDLTLDYWVGFSWFNNNTTSGVIKKLNFSSYKVDN